jgi:hypothetical protein
MESHSAQQSSKQFLMASTAVPVPAPSSSDPSESDVSTPSPEQAPPRLLSRVTPFLDDPDAGYNEHLAAEFLGLSVRTLQSYRISGRGPRFCRLGRRVTYTRRELIAWQQANMVRSTTEADARDAALVQA